MVLTLQLCSDCCQRSIRCFVDDSSTMNRCPQTEFFVADLGEWVCGVWEG